MARHVPGKVWACRLRAANKDENAFVSTFSAKTIEIAFFAAHEREWAKRLLISRATARLLARRILQCLEETK